MKTITTIAELRNIPLLERAEWYIPESLSTTMPIEDNGEELQRVQKAFDGTDVPVILSPVSPDPYKEMFLRETVLQKLVNVGKRIYKESQERIVLKITDPFRPLVLQRKYFEEIREEISQKERLTGEALWNRVTEFIADPDLCPPHSTGGAIDLTLAYADTAQELDMGTPVDAIDDRANTWHSDLTEIQKNNRLMLWQAMTDEGFVNLASEWWHYSYGDSYWAAFHDMPHALYASIESPPV